MNKDVGVASLFRIGSNSLLYLTVEVISHKAEDTLDSCIRVSYCLEEINISVNKLCTLCLIFLCVGAVILTEVDNYCLRLILGEIPLKVRGVLAVDPVPGKAKVLIVFRCKKRVVLVSTVCIARDNARSAYGNEAVISVKCACCKISISFCSVLVRCGEALLQAAVCTVAAGD